MLENDLLEKVGIKIKTYRESKGLTQIELSVLCDLHRNYIGSVESGDRNFSLKTLEKIANGLNLLPKDLLE